MSAAVDAVVMSAGHRESAIRDLRERGLGTIVAIYVGDVPSELLFIGFSGD